MNVVRKLASCRQTEETGIVIVSRYSLYSLVSRPCQRGREGLVTSSHFGLAVAMDSPKSIKPFKSLAGLHYYSVNLKCAK